MLKKVMILITLASCLIGLILVGPNTMADCKQCVVRYGHWECDNTPSDGGRDCDIIGTRCTLDGVCRANGGLGGGSDGCDPLYWWTCDDPWSY